MPPAGQSAFLQVRVRSQAASTVPARPETRPYSRCRNQPSGSSCPPAKQTYAGNSRIPQPARVPGALEFVDILHVLAFVAHAIDRCPCRVIGMNRSHVRARTRAWQLAGEWVIVGNILRASLRHHVAHRAIAFRLPVALIRMPTAKFTG